MWKKTMVWLVAGLVWGWSAGALAQTIDLPGGEGPALEETVADLLEGVDALDPELAFLLDVLLADIENIDEGGLEELAGLIEVIEGLDEDLAAELKFVFDALGGGPSVPPLPPGDGVLDGKPVDGDPADLSSLLAELAELDEELALLLEQLLGNDTELDPAESVEVKELLEVVADLDEGLAAQLRLLARLNVFVGGGGDGAPPVDGLIGLLDKLASLDEDLALSVEELLDASGALAGADAGEARELLAAVAALDEGLAAGLRRFLVIETGGGEQPPRLPLDFDALLGLLEELDVELALWAEDLLFEVEELDQEALAEARELVEAVAELDEAAATRLRRYLGTLPTVGGRDRPPVPAADLFALLERLAGLDEELADLLEELLADGDPLADADLDEAKELLDEVAGLDEGLAAALRRFAVGSARGDPPVPAADLFELLDALAGLDEELADLLDELLGEGEPLEGEDAAAVREALAAVAELDGGLAERLRFFVRLADAAGGGDGRPGDSGPRPVADLFALLEKVAALDDELAAALEELLADGEPLEGDAFEEAKILLEVVAQLDERLAAGLRGFVEGGGRPLPPGARSAFEDLLAVLEALGEIDLVEELLEALTPEEIARIDAGEDLAGEGFSKGLELFLEANELVGEIDRETIEELLADFESGGGPAADADERFARWLGSDFAEDINEDGRIDRRDFEEFLEDFAEGDGLLRFEGLLEGIDFAERLLIIDGDFFEPAPELLILDNQEREIGLARLREILGRALKVAVLLNEADEVLQLVILSRVDNILPDEPLPAAREFFGEVGRLDGDNIVLRGPRFAVTERTRAANANNRAIQLGIIDIGQLLSVVPGPPEADSGDPVALRVQVANPRNPPAPGADRVVGVLVSAGGPDSDDPHLQLAGPIAEVNDGTAFGTPEGGVEREALQVGDFVRLEVREPGFGETNPVAIAVTILGGPEDGVLPPADDGDVEEIQLEGLVIDVDADEGFLALEGQRLLLAEDVNVIDFAGSFVGLEDLLPGDFLEIETQADGLGGFAVTRLTVIDPALQVFERPGIFLGAFEEVDGDELVLAGPFLEVPEDADIRGRGGVLIGLDELEIDDYVRVAAAAPRFNLGETLPVALKIRVVQAPNAEPVAPGEPNGRQRFVGSFPEDGDIEVPLETEVEVTFSQPVFGLVRQPGFRFEIFPEPLKTSGLEISADGRSVSLEAHFEEDRVYQLAVITPATGVLEITFTTGEELAAGAIAGTIVAPDELPANVKFSPDDSFVLLVEDFENEDLFDDGFAEEENLFDLIEENIVAAIPLDGRQFRIGNVPEGDYFVVAFVGFDLGRGDFVELQAFLDEDEDGEPDLVEVGENEEVEVELVLQLPEPLHIVELTPERRSTGVDEEAEITVVFNKPAFLDEEDILVFPEPLDILDFEASEDLTEYTLTVLLEDDTIYRAGVEFAEDEDGGELVEGARTIFTTGDEFGEVHTVSGRLVLPHLPAARRFDGPALVGLIPFGEIDPDGFGFDSFDEEDIVAFTTTRTPEYVIEDVRPGVYVAVAFVLVDVPRGFRPPDPLERALERFEIDEGRFAAQVIEVFDTIELFGFHSGDDPRRPARVIEDAENVNVFLRSNARSRRDLLRITQAGFPDTRLVQDTDGRPPLVDPDEDEIAVRFNKEIRAGRGFVAVEAALNGRPLRPTGVSDNGHTAFFAVELDEGEFYRFSVFEAEAVDGSELDEPFDVGFRTGELDLAFGGITGRVTLETFDTDGNALTGDDADQIDAAKVLLYEAEADEDGRPVLAAVARVNEDGVYRIGEVEPGAYRVAAEILASSGQETRGIYDADGDGRGDVVRVVPDEVAEGIDIAGRVTVETGDGEDPPKTTPPGGNETAVLSIDLDPADGDQALSTLSGVEVGQQVTMDVYISGAVDLSGVALKLRYDADILTFVDATDAVPGRTNFLRKDGDLAIWLFPLLREPVLEYGGSILGAVSAPDGDGFLARFQFEVSAQFEGAQIILEEANLKSLTGQDILTPDLSAKLAPPVFVEQVKGPISIDLDPQAGDQETFHKGFIEAGDEVVADFYINFDRIGDGTFTDLSNYSVTVEFDAKKLDYVSYTPETSEEANVLIAGGGTVPVLPAITSKGKVTFGNAVLGPTAATAPDAGGFIGRLTFTAKGSFSQTDLLITSYAYKSIEVPQQEITSLIFSRLSDGEIEFSSPISGGGDGGDGGLVTAAKVDFDGSGAVDFGDFFALADCFGQRAVGVCAPFDIDGSELVDFGDFFPFADLFGQSVGKAVPRAYAFEPVDAGLSLEAVSIEEGLEVRLLTEGFETRGFRAVVEYDPTAFRLEKAGAEGLEDGTRPALLISQDTDGRVLLVGASTGGAASGALANLRFVPVSPESAGLFRLASGQVRGGADLLQPVLGAAVEGRWVPQSFALKPNYPNPFNPSTTIGFQLPQASEVRLELFDVLGQKVRTLVKASLPAGAHKAVWDGRDQAGRSVAAGTYFYCLEAGGFSQVRKLMLIK